MFIDVDLWAWGGQGTTRDSQFSLCTLLVLGIEAGVFTWCAISLAFSFVSIDIVSVDNLHF